MADRGTLRSIILTTTGQDINKCMACQYCYVAEALEAKFDMPLCQVITAARKDDKSALTNQTIWALIEADPDSVCCANGLDVLTIIQVLCQEARRRGLS